MLTKTSKTTTLYNHRILFFSGLASCIAYAALALNSQYYGDASIALLFSTSSVCALLCFCVFLHYWLSKKELPIAGLLAFSILFRFIAVFAFPILEDDIFRYLWDGRMAFELHDPYTYPPAYFFDSALNDSFEQILGLINYPEIATIYGPVCQWVFALAYWIAPGEVWPLQAIFATADVLLILVLLKLARPLWVLLYAWSPLIIKEFAFTAHPDVLGALFLMIALLAYRHKLFFIVGCAMALAAGVKLFAVIILPFLFGFKLRAWAAFVITAVLVAAPWGVVDSWLPPGLLAMSSDWLFNAPLYLLLAPLISAHTLKSILLCTLALGTSAHYLKHMRAWQDIKIRGDYLFIALFICIPVFNPWYLVWLLPFAVIYPSYRTWAASLSLLLSYASGINLTVNQLALYEQPNWVVFIEFIVILIAAIISPLAGNMQKQNRG